jgi:uncharacterized protein (TIGR04255 family)
LTELTSLAWSSVAQPTTLTRPPITEALVDLRATIPGDLESFSALAKQLKHRFPHLQENRQFEGKLEFKDGDVRSHVSPPAFAGIFAANEEKTIYVQFRPDGFTLNNVVKTAGSYIGGDRLIGEALDLWNWLVEQTEITGVSRVGLYYLNQLNELPLKPGEKTNLYFQNPPSLPHGSPQTIKGFLTQVTAYDHDREANAIVIQQVKPSPQKDEFRRVRIAVDVFRTGTFPVEAAPLGEVLGSLRQLKNEIFFSLLTDKTVRHYQ